MAEILHDARHATPALLATETPLATAIAARQPSADAGPEQTLRDEMARLGGEVGHLAAASAAGGELAALLAALQERAAPAP
jgi:hypothetical protein